MENDSITSSANVVTDRPGRYGKQLVSHLSRRSPGTWDDGAGTGTIRFDQGHATLAGDGDVLRLSLTTTPALVERLEDVLGRHLVRFATKDTLDVQWHRGDGTSGTHQSSGAPQQAHAGPA